MNWRSTVIGIALTASSAISAHADTRDEVMAGEAQCASIADNRAWLDCIYGAVQPMRALLGLPPAPQWHGPPAPARAPSPPPSREQASSQSSGDFGMRAPAPVLPGVTARMAFYTFDNYHHFTVGLANGQVWSQLDGDTSQARWSKPAGLYTVSITNGFLGSFNLKVAGEPGSFKVIRAPARKN